MFFSASLSTTAYAGSGTGSGDTPSSVYFGKSCPGFHFHDFQYQKERLDIVPLLKSNPYLGESDTVSCPTLSNLICRVNELAGREAVIYHRDLNLKHHLRAFLDFQTGMSFSMLRFGILCGNK
jgi:hypothetical protein